MSSFNTPISSYNRLPLLSVLSQALRMEGFDQYIAEQLALNSNSNSNPSYMITPNMNMNRSLLNELFPIASETENDIALIKDRIDLLEQTVNNYVKISSDLMKEVNSLETELKNVWDSYYEMEKDLYQYLQYSRRENIEISGLPQDIPDNQLESIMVKLLRDIGVNVEHYDIVGCHWL